MKRWLLIGGICFSGMIGGVMVDGWADMSAPPASIDPATDCTRYHKATDYDTVQAILDQYESTANMTSQEKRWICFDGSQVLPIDEPDQQPLVVTNTSSIPLVVYGLNVRFFGKPGVFIQGNNITLQKALIQGAALKISGTHNMVYDSDVAGGILLDGNLNTLNAVRITDATPGVTVSGTNHTIVASTLTSTSGGTSIKLSGSGHVVKETTVDGSIQAACNWNAQIKPGTGPSCIIGPGNTLHGIYIPADGQQITITKNTFLLSGNQSPIFEDTGANGGFPVTDSDLIGLTAAVDTNGFGHIIGGLNTEHCVPPRRGVTPSVELFIEGEYQQACPVSTPKGTPTALVGWTGKPLGEIPSTSCYFDCGDVYLQKDEHVGAVYTDTAGNSLSYVSADFSAEGLPSLDLSQDVSAACGTLIVPTLIPYKPLLPTVFANVKSYAKAFSNAYLLCFDPQATFGTTGFNGSTPYTLQNYGSKQVVIYGLNLALPAASDTTQPILSLRGKHITLQNVKVTGSIKNGVGLNLKGSDMTLKAVTIDGPLKGIVADGERLHIDSSTIASAVTSTGIKEWFSEAEHDAYCAKYYKNSVGITLSGQQNEVTNSNITDFFTSVYANCAWQVQSNEPSCRIGPGNIFEHSPFCHTGDDASVYIPVSGQQVLVTENTDRYQSVTPSHRYVYLEEGANGGMKNPIEREWAGGVCNSPTKLIATVVGKIPPERCNDASKIELFEIKYRIKIKEKKAFVEGAPLSKCELKFVGGVLPFSRMFLIDSGVVCDKLWEKQLLANECIFECNLTQPTHGGLFKAVVTNSQGNTSSDVIFGFGLEGALITTPYGSAAVDVSDNGTPDLIATSDPPIPPEQGDTTTPTNTDPPPSDSQSEPITSSLIPDLLESAPFSGGGCSLILHQTVVGW